MWGQGWVRAVCKQPMKTGIRSSVCVLAAFGKPHRADMRRGGGGGGEGDIKGLAVLIHHGGSLNRGTGRTSTAPAQWWGTLNCTQRALRYGARLELSTSLFSHIPSSTYTHRTLRLSVRCVHQEAIGVSIFFIWFHWFYPCVWKCSLVSYPLPNSSQYLPSKLVEKTWPSLSPLSTSTVAGGGQTGHIYSARARHSSQGG